MNIWGIGKDKYASLTAIGFDSKNNYVSVKRIVHTTGIYKDYPALRAHEVYPAHEALRANRSPTQYQRAGS